MVAAARASVDYIRASLDIATAGGFIPTFELSNCSFNAAMVLLYVLRNHGGDTEQEEFIQSYENALDDTARLLVSLFSFRRRREKLVMRTFRIILT